jgi:hypothetical protein
MHKASPDGREAPSSEAANLYSLSAVFAFTAYNLPLNNDNTALWPCFGSYDGSANSSENPDCPTVGDPKTGLYAGGMVTGAPAYTWSLSDCTGTSTTSPYCGEVDTFYEDDTVDLTDDELYTVEITQGSNVIYDSGTEDIGPNYFNLTPSEYPIQVIFTSPANFGTQGETGENNGNCFPSVNYPLATNSYTGYYQVAANKTCVAPVAGPATVTATTEFGTPVYTADTKGTGGAGQTCTKTAPCYTVKWTKKYSISQKFTIYLQ